MADSFSPSPRSSKRRRIATYSGALRTTTSGSSVIEESVPAGVSSIISSISRRFFDRKVMSRVTNVPNDSAYASEETNTIDEDVLLDTTKSNLLEKAQRDVDAAWKEGIPKLGSDDSSDTNDNRLNTRRSEQLAVPSDDSAIRKKARNVKAIKSIWYSASQTRLTAQENVESSQDIEKDMVPEGRQDMTMARKALLQAREIQSEDEAELLQKSKEAEDADSDTIIVEPRSSGRERKRPRRFSIDPLEQQRPQKVQSASILTPSKQRRGRPRRSVAFEEANSVPVHNLGFKDINEKQRPAKKAKPTKWKIIEMAATVVTDPGLSSPNLPGDFDTSQVSDLSLLDEAELPGPDVSDLDTILKPVTTEVHGKDNQDEPELLAIKSIILSRLTSRCPSSVVPPQLTPTYTRLYALLSSAITQGESNSLLLLGSRGSGKSLLFESAVANLSREHEDSFHVVRLNGFIHTDDKLALREIWRQLGREMDVDEDETNQVNSYADTMASLLSLLSHPEELAETFDPHAAGKTTKSVIFLLDEFDLFTKHARQTLLYNLFDIAQARKAPIVVIGCSTRMDVIDCLEKRVKSRFSHRWLHVPPVKSIGQFEEVVRDTLLLDTTTLMGDIDKRWQEEWNQAIKTSFLPSPQIQTLIHQIYHTTKSTSDLLMALYLPIATLNVSEPLSPIVYHGLPLPSYQLTPPYLLAALPSLHLSLLTSAARLDTIHCLPTVNFNLIYTHYAELCGKMKLQASAAGALAHGGGMRLWGREVSLSAWEELGTWGFIAPAVSVEDGGLETRMWKVDVGIEDVAWAVRSAGGSVGEVLGKWCREV